MTELQVDSQTLTITNQIKHEEDMLQRGINAFRVRNAELERKGQLSQTKAGQRIASGGVDRVIDKISEWTQNQWLASKGRPQCLHPAYSILTSVDLQVVSVVALRVVLNHLRHNPQLQSLAVKVADAIETELRFEFAESKAKEDKTEVELENGHKATKGQLWDWAMKKVRKSGHERYGRNILNFTTKTLDLTSEWNPWSEGTRVKLGALMIYLIKQATGIVDITTKPTLGPADTTLYVVATDGTLAWLKAHNLEAELLCPVRMPCIIPPKDWSSAEGGGYYSDRLPPLSIVKTGFKPYLRDFEALNPTKVYGAINNLQRTGWQINKKVLEVVRCLWTGAEPVAGLPPHVLPEPPKKPEDIETNEQARKVYRRLSAQIYAKRHQLGSKHLQVSQILAMADELTKYDAFYFVYQMDFRGRVYIASSSALQPQGCDLAKGLLRFSKGKKMDAKAFEWFCIHGANCAGVDKVSFQDRLQWVKDNHQNILDSAVDPISCRWWMDVSKKDNPLMFLAWVLEYAAYVADPVNFESHISVQLDGSCSGLQHFSALLRDPIGAKSVNLDVSDKPNDIYADVARVATELLQGERDPGNIEFARKWLEYGLSRKATKRPTMTICYGATLFSHKQFIKDWVEEREETEHVQNPFGDLLIEACGYLARTVWEAIGRVVKAARAAMDWLKEAAKAAAKKGLPVSWVTPSGFPVMQAYKDTTSRRVELVLGSELIRVSMAKELEDKLDKSRQASGISPNFVHSADASQVHLICNHAGGMDLCVVHDSFGTHAADTEKFSHLIKQTFVEMYEQHDLLAEFKEHVESLGLELAALPVKGSFDIRRVLDSAYCFA